MSESETQTQTQSQHQQVGFSFTDSTLKEIKTYEELLPFLKPVADLHNSLTGKWDPEFTITEFITKLVEEFVKGKLIVWADKEDNDIKYFMAVSNQKPTAVFWLFYIKPKSGLDSKTLGKLAIDNIRSMGYDSIQLSSIRIKKSYDQWMKKLGFSPVKIIYEQKL